VTTELADTALMRERFEDDGMIVLGRVLSDAEVEGVRESMVRFVETIVPELPPQVRDKIVRYEPDGRSVRSCYALDKVDPFFAELGHREDFVELVRSMTGWEPELYAVESFNKTAQAGTAVPMHQEAAFGGPDMLQAAHLWLAIDDATEANGPVRYWLGSHKQGMMPHAPEENGYLTCDERLADERATEVFTLVAPAGHGALHNSLIAHDSLPNRSSKPRLGIFCGYRKA
jgi:phytanoyl-CoA hydroxylase